MKKLISIIAVILCTAALSACGTAEAAVSTSNETTTADTFADSTTDVPVKFDFSAVVVSSCRVLGIGESYSLPADTQGEIYMSKPSVAAADENASITAIQPGVTIAAYEKDGKQTATAVCVLPDGDATDPSASAPVPCEAGTSEILSPDMIHAEISSTNDAVAFVSDSRVFFGDCGYAVISMTSASVPRLTSYVVFDRVSE